MGCAENGSSIQCQPKKTKEEIQAQNRERARRYRLRKKQAAGEGYQQFEQDPAVEREAIERFGNLTIDKTLPLSAKP